MNDEVTFPIQKAGGWICKTSHCVYQNPWIKVFHQEVVTPAGTDGIYGLVHFNTRAIGVVPIDEEGNTWLVRQSRYTLNDYTWEIPEGGCPSDEDPLNCAQRELREEVGLTASSWTELLQLHTSNSVTDESGVVYVARGLQMGNQQLEDSEDIVVKKLPLADAINMVLQGEITDAMSIAALLKVAVQKDKFLPPNAATA